MERETVDGASEPLMDRTEGNTGPAHAGATLQFTSTDRPTRTLDPPYLVRHAPDTPIILSTCVRGVVSTPHFMTSVARTISRRGAGGYTTIPKHESKTQTAVTAVILSVTESPMS